MKIVVGEKIVKFLKINEQWIFLGTARLGFKGQTKVSDLFHNQFRFDDIFAIQFDIKCVHLTQFPEKSLDFINSLKMISQETICHALQPNNFLNIEITIKMNKTIHSKYINLQ